MAKDLLPEEEPLPINLIGTLGANHADKIKDKDKIKSKKHIEGLGNASDKLVLRRDRLGNIFTDME